MYLKQLKGVVGLQGVTVPVRHYSNLNQPVGVGAGAVSGVGGVGVGGQGGSKVVATVFGATGFLGRYVVNRLARSGAQIVVPYRGEVNSYNHLKVVGEVGQLVPCEFSIRDQDSIKHAVSQSSIVVNLLGRKYNTRNYTMDEVHVDAAATIAKAAKEAGVKKFVQVSTLNADVNHRSNWARTKALGEKAVLDAFPEATVVRTAPVYGHEDDLLNKFGYFVKWSPIIPLLLNPQTKFQPLFARDFGAAVMEILSDPHSQGRTYELGGPDVLTVDQFLHDVILEFTKVPKEKIIVVPSMIAEKIAPFFAIPRKPLYTQDEVIFYEKDILVGKGAFTFDTLKTKPGHIKENAMSTLLPYRRTSTFSPV